jgi:hypothetical protein
MCALTAGGALTRLVLCQFGDNWTPSHLTSGLTNLYKDIALALKGVPQLSA